MQIVMTRLLKAYSTELLSTLLDQITQKSVNPGDDSDDLLLKSLNAIDTLEDLCMNQGVFLTLIEPKLLNRIVSAVSSC